MAEPLRPAATKTHGYKNYHLIPTWAGYAAGTGPTVAEYTSASGLDITRILFAGGGPWITQTTNLVEQQRRWGDTVVSEWVGETKYSGGTLEYQLASQAAALADGVKLWELIPALSQFYLVRRLGIGRAVTPIATHRVSGVKIEFGPSLEIEHGEGESAEAGATCMFGVVDPPVQRVAVVA